MSDKKVMSRPCCTRGYTPARLLRPALALSKTPLYYAVTLQIDAYGNLMGTYDYIVLILVVAALREYFITNVV